MANLSMSWLFVALIYVGFACALWAQDGSCDGAATGSNPERRHTSARNRGPDDAPAQYEQRGHVISMTPNIAFVVDFEDSVGKLPCGVCSPVATQSIDESAPTAPVTLRPETEVGFFRNKVGPLILIIGLVSIGVIGCMAQRSQK